MREILFKGKCIDETCLKGKWLEGDILHDGVVGKYYINTGNCLNESDNVGEEGLLQFVAYEVDSETVCQYTGLTDKNGRKIFEGDIVRENLKGLKLMERKVVWDKEEGAWMSESESGVRYGIGNANSRSLEVIGNIFDNPELIGE